MRLRLMRPVWALGAFLLLVAASCVAADTSASEPDYLALVTAYADAMLEHGRDRYGKEHSPLFAAAMDRETLVLGGGGDIEGIRNGDRTLSGANPMHDLNLYQVLYGLAEITGDARYSAEADKALRYYFAHCQSPVTGLMVWGEHMGWDFHLEAPFEKGAAAADIHEFYRPWVLAERSSRLAPEAFARMARGLWEHQIYDQSIGNFSRHAHWRRHGPGTLNEYPRHGGFYIAMWGTAYEQTKDPVFLQAIETLVDFYHSIRNPSTGMIPCSTNPDRAKVVWPESNLSLAIDCWSTAQHVPEALAKKLRRSSSQTDSLFLKLKHDFSPGGIGFVSGAVADTLEAFDTGAWTHTQPWATGYGKQTDAQEAMLCYLRHSQVGLEGYRKLLLAAAERYLDSEPDAKVTLYPGAMGDVVFLMIASHELTGDEEYLDRGGHFAQFALSQFFTPGSPLPKASSKHEHYEAITRADTLMMALLKLWAVRNAPDKTPNLLYCDR